VCVCVYPAAVRLKSERDGGAISSRADVDAKANQIALLTEELAVVTNAKTMAETAKKAADMRLA
jgi:hypothetical protein